MIRAILNQFPARYGSYSAEGKKIRRIFSSGFSYIAKECKSLQEAQRIVKDLNQLLSK